MKLISLIAPVLTVLAGCCSNPGINVEVAKTEPPTTIELASLTKSFTVALTSDGEFTTQTFCAGVWVSETHILTADHCARALLEQILELDADANPLQRPLIAALVKGSKIEFITPEDANGPFERPKRKRNAFVSQSDYVHDLAMLTVLEEDVPVGHAVVTLANTAAVAGEEVHVMGHPGGLPWSYAHGYIAAERTTFLPAGPHDGPWFQVDVAAWRGNSGGGVYNSNGELLGIASFLTPAPGHVMFVHLDAVRQFVSTELPPKL